MNTPDFMFRAKPIHRQFSADAKQDLFLELYTPVQSSLSRFVYSLTGNSSIAEDIIQETLLQCYKSIEQIQSREAFLSYLFTTARRIYKRLKLRKKLVSFFSEEEVEDIVGASDTRADYGVDVSELHKALDKLSELQKEAVVLFEIVGFSIEEIAKIQNSNVPTVKSRLQRGRAKLAGLMGVSNS